MDLGLGLGQGMDSGSDDDMTVFGPDEDGQQDIVENELEDERQPLAGMADLDDYEAMATTIDEDAEFAEIAMPVDGQPALIYEAPLRVQYLGRTRTEARIQLYRNNLAAASQELGLVFIATGSVVQAYEFGINDGTLSPKPIYLLQTRPLDGRISAEQLREANWSTMPHYINNLRICRLFGLEVLVTAGDDGRCQIYEVAKILRKARALGRSGVDSGNCIFRVRPLVEIQVPSSAWGIDVSERHCMVAISSNKRCVHLFRVAGLRAADGTFARVPPITPDRAELYLESPKLGHNIPDVEFVEHEAGSQDEIVYVSCVSISGEVALWEFYYGDRLERHREMMSEQEETASSSTPSTASSRRSSLRPSDVEQGDFRPDQVPLDLMDLRILDSGSVSSTPARTPTRASSARATPATLRKLYKYKQAFSCGRYWYREELKQPGWTINGLRDCDFKQVGSLAEVTGNNWVNETALFANISKENAAVLRRAGLDVVKTNFPVVRFTSFEIETKFAQSLSHGPWSSLSQTPHYSLPLMHFKEDKKEYYLNEATADKLTSAVFRNQFFLTTTKESMYLCRVEDLFCNGARANVFNWERPYDDEIHFDKLSLVVVVPALSAVVVASQVGVVSIFRLTKYREVYCIRQEYCFPLAVDSFTFAEYPKRVIVGMAVCPVPTPEGDALSQRRFRLCLVHLRGVVSTYELVRNEQGIYLDEAVI